MSEYPRSGRLRSLVGSNAPWLLIGWTVVLWSSRLRNVLADDDLTSTGRAVRVGVVVVFVALALGAAWRWRQGRRDLMAVLIVWSVGYWIIRGGGILIGDWSVSFKVVHTVLMVVSLACAGLAARVVWPRSTGSRSHGSSGHRADLHTR